jgi:hypothetical protein
VVPPEVDETNVGAMSLTRGGAAPGFGLPNGPDSTPSLADLRIRPAILASIVSPFDVKPSADAILRALEILDRTKVTS